MEIVCTKKNNSLRVLPNGKLTSESKGELAKIIAENFAQDIDSLVLDFENVSFVSSSGLRDILTLKKNYENLKIKIVNANQPVMYVLEITGLSQLFEVSAK